MECKRKKEAKETVGKLKAQNRNKCKCMGDTSMWMVIETTRENEISPREGKYMEERRGLTIEFRETER